VAPNPFVGDVHAAGGAEDALAFRNGVGVIERLKGAGGDPIKDFQGCLGVGEDLQVPTPSRRTGWWPKVDCNPRRIAASSPARMPPCALTAV